MHTAPLICLPSLARARKHTRALALCAALLLSCGAQAAQFVEVIADIEVTSWRYHEETGLPLKNSRTFSVRCVVGTNTWLIERNSTNTAQESVWFVEGKIIRLTTPAQDVISTVPEDSEFRSMRRGTRYLNILAAADGYPAGDLFLNLPWFAFCSGPYLKRPGQSVPLPTPPQDRAAFGFQHEKTVFPDSLGLPQRVRFYNGQKQLKCDYQVQQSTNMLGWNFPTAFTVVQNEPNSLGVWNRQLAITARVKSVQPAPEPALPEEVRLRVEMWERYPTRRK
jgi:hypothetical protein